MSRDAATKLAAAVALTLVKKNLLGPNSAAWKTEEQIEELTLKAKGVLPGQVMRSTLGVSDFALPESVADEVSMLAYDYGDARRYANFYPLAKGINKLPTAANAPDFGYIAEVTTTVPEKSPSWNSLTLEGNRAGGAIRFPREFTTERLDLFGQYLGRYIARRMAKLEDQTLFLADGTATYKSQVGACKHAVDEGHKVTLGAGLVKATDITLQDMRELRKQVNSDVLAESSYYLHPSFEQRLVTFNTGGNKPYVAETSPPRLDGFPVLFTGVLPVCDTAAHASQVQLLFGNLEFWTLGVVPAIGIRISAGAAFLTDEFLLLALQFMEVGPLADDAIAALQLAAA
jgi:HK97 family phage major capsid protein